MSKTELDPWTTDVIEAVKGWVKEEKGSNPSWSLIVGSKSFSLDQLEEHLDERTPEGQMILKMIARMAVDRFKRKYRD